MTVRPGVAVHLLSGLDGSVDSVTALNDLGEVVGVRISPGPQRAFRWTAASGGNILPMPSGWFSSQALGVNNNGTIVGEATQARLTPVQWSGGTLFRTMGILFPRDSIPGQAPGCTVRGINAQGLMTGACVDPRAGEWWVAEWTPSGQVRDFCADIGCPFAGYSYAINSNEVIAGGPASTAALNAFLIFPQNTIDTLLTILQTPHATNIGVALAINDMEIAAGWAGAVSPGGPCNAPVVWQSIRQAPLNIGGGNCGQATGIDANNVVVGTAFLAQGYQAFIWTQSTGIQALPGLGAPGETSTAVAINSNHEVLGTLTSNRAKYDVIWTF